MHRKFETVSNSKFQNFSKYENKMVVNNKKPSLINNRWIKWAPNQTKSFTYKNLLTVILIYDIALPVGNADAQTGMISIFSWPGAKFSLRPIFLLPFQKPMEITQMLWWLFLEMAGLQSGTILASILSLRHPRWRPHLQVIFWKL